VGRRPLIPVKQSRRRIGVGKLNSIDVKSAMSRINVSLLVCSSLAAFSVFGCESDNSKMTPTELDAFSHPKAVPGAKGPTAGDYAKMNSEIAAYNQKHKNDKVEFNAPGK